MYNTCVHYKRILLYKEKPEMKVSQTQSKIELLFKLPFKNLTDVLTVFKIPRMVIYPNII